MKKGNIKVVILLLFGIALLIGNFISFNIMKYINTVYIVYAFILCIISYILLGYRNVRNINKVDTMQIMFIYVFIFLILSYLSGLFLGYTRNPLKVFSFVTFKTVYLPFILGIIFSEIFRYMVVIRTNKDYKTISLLVLLFVLWDTSILYGECNMHTLYGVFTFFGIHMLSSIFKNSMLTYVSLKSGIIPCIFYRIVMELYIYVLPISPDLGIYFKAVVGVVFPVIILLRINTLYAKNMVYSTNKYKFIRRLVELPIIGIAILIIMLGSGIFEYRLVAIASNSMNPIFKRGDSVFVKRIDNSIEVDSLRNGDIIAFKHQNVIIVHRIYKIDKSNGKYTYTTKGDNNDSVDKWIIYEDDLIGVVNKVIPYIGYPSVLLNESFK